MSTTRTRIEREIVRMAERSRKKATTSWSSFSLGCYTKATSQRQTATQSVRAQLKHKAEQREANASKLLAPICEQRMRLNSTRRPKLGQFLTSRSFRFNLTLLGALVILCSLLSNLSSLLASTSSSETSQTPSTAGPGAAASSSSAAAAAPFGDPIKLSFGGWTPLDVGQDKKRPQNVSSSGKSKSGEPMAATSPLPPNGSQSRGLQGDSRPPIRPNNLGASLAHKHQLSKKRNDTSGHRQQSELMNESASSSHEKVQFVAPANGHESHNQQHHPLGQLHSGPAYALPLHRLPQFSPPAPAPIVRDHLLPAANHNQPAHYPPSAQHLSARPPHAQNHQMMAQQQQQQQHMHFQRQNSPSHRYHQRHFQQQQRHHEQMMQQHHHRQQMLQHQMMIEQQARPQHKNHMHRPAHHQHFRQQAHMTLASQQQPLQGQMMDSARAAIPRYPGSPLAHQHHSQQVPPQVGSFRLVEGEQPIMFTSPLSNEHIPMIEVSGHNQVNPQQARNNESSQAEHSQQHANDNRGQGGEQSPNSEYSQTLAAIERDNLNYQNALKQVSAYAPEEQQSGQQAQGNNIQDIKQRQQQQQFERQKPVNDKPISSAPKSSYLTIPVAVETEGDKVLTPDDLNEIEKHVINVLPSLKTADKIVKLANAQLTIAGIDPSSAAHQLESGPRAQQPHPGQNMQQANYEEHRSTLKQLEGDIRGLKQHEPQPQQQHRQPADYSSTSSQQTTPNEAQSSAPYSPSGSMNQATTSSAQHTDTPAQQQRQQQHEQEQHQQMLNEQHQYFIAAGPLQDSLNGNVEQLGEMNEYNLMKNDLLNSLRYEPTRAASGASSPSSPTSSQHKQRQQQQTASTPPMPYTASSPQQYGRPTSAGPSSTRYFQHGQASPADQQQQQQAYSGGRVRPNGLQSSLFGRLNGPRANQQQQQQHYPTSTTRTIMGGRKVSEVMRPLIRTTPVPMTSPLHIPSVEPEKVDAIQLIAGQANDKRPVVVEPHQLVQHTPDGGIDYNSGSPLGAQQEQQHQQQHPMQQFHQNQNQNQNQNQSQAYEREQQSGQYGPQMGHEQSGDNQPGAIIEYVAISDQALNQAVVQQQEQHNPQAYEISGQPEVQPMYVSAEPQLQIQQQQQQQQPDNGYSADSGTNGPNDRAPPFNYDYTMTTQHDASVTHAEPDSGSSSSAGNSLSGGSSQTPPSYSGENGSSSMPSNSQQHESQPSLAWSPSVASEHQQQQLELSEHAQQMDLPATAGYNFFAQQPEQQQQQQQQQHPTSQAPSDNRQQRQQQQQQQQQEYQYQEHEQQNSPHSGWRTKAGGSQPNPDAQYDGQIVKGTNQEQEVQNNNHEQLIEEQQAQQQLQAQQQYSNYGSPQQPQQQTVELVRISAASNQRPSQEDHMQQQQQQQQLSDNGNEQPQQLTDVYQQQLQQPQQHQIEQQLSTPASQVRAGDSYLGTNSFVGGAQMNHVTPSRANNDQQQYSQPPASTEGPYGYTKLDRDHQQSHLEQHQAQHQAQLAEILSSQQPYQTTTPISITTLAAIEQQQQENQQQQQQQQQQNNNGYMVEEVQSRPSVQSPPESMLVNESPMQVPILDQQSLIADPSQDSNNGFSEDDGAKQQQQPQSAGVYQVYQAYYAPRDHKPLPGYVRLSLEEFHELFRDAEIQYVDRNLNGLANDQQQQQQQQQLNSMPMSVQSVSDGRSPAGDSMNAAYQQQPQSQGELMKASASENQSILVDRRSISNVSSDAASASTGRSSANSTSEPQLTESAKIRDRKLKLGQAVKKIISIRNARQLAKQTEKQAGAKSSGSPLKKSTSLSMTTPSSVTLDFTSTELPNKVLNAQKQNKTTTSKKKVEIPNKKVSHQHHSKVIQGSLIETSTTPTHNLGENKQSTKQTA